MKGELNLTEEDRPQLYKLDHPAATINGAHCSMSGEVITGSGTK